MVWEHKDYMPFIDATLQVQAVVQFKVTVGKEDAHNNTEAIIIVESLYRSNADSVERDKISGWQKYLSCGCSCMI